MAQPRPVVVVVGAGFVGFHALRRLEKLLPPEAADLVLISPNDFLLYSPLLPDVTAGVVEPRHIAVSLRQRLRDNPDDMDAKVDVGSDESMDASDPPSTSAPGRDMPMPSSGFIE